MKIWEYRFPSVNHEGWALVILRADGFFAAVSDYGNFAFRWSATGCKDFREFFLNVQPDYICSKLGSQELDRDASFENVRKLIIEQRRANDLERDEARAMYDAVRIYESDGVWEAMLYSSVLRHLDPWECFVMRYQPQLVAFAEKIVCGRLRQAIRFELSQEAVSA